MQQADPETPNRYIWKPAGTVVDHPDVVWLVRAGVAEPHDEECKAACEAWYFPESAEYMAATYDQRECGAATGDSRYDSSIGDQSALQRMRKRLQCPDNTDAADVIKRHRELLKQLKQVANDKYAERNATRQNAATIPDADD